MWNFTRVYTFKYTVSIYSIHHVGKLWGYHHQLMVIPHLQICLENSHQKTMTSFTRSIYLLGRQQALELLEFMMDGVKWPKRSKRALCFLRVIHKQHFFQMKIIREDPHMVRFLGPRKNHTMQNLYYWIQVV